MADIVTNVPLYPSTALQTVTAAVSTAATLTIAAPAAGLFNYITWIEARAYCSVAIAAGNAAPILVTTTNITGSPVIQLPQKIMAVGEDVVSQLVLGHPGVKSTANATATTIVAPLVTNIIWRLTAAFYVAP